jgi:hypothetical protein
LPQAGALSVKALALIDVASRAYGFNDDAPLPCRHLIDHSILSLAEIEAPQVVGFRQLPGIRWARIFFQGFQQIKGFQEILGRGDPIQGSLAFRRDHNIVLRNGRVGVGIRLG